MKAPSLALAALILISPLTPAHAHTWIAHNAVEDTCVPAPEGASSPAMRVQALRKQGYMPALDIIRDKTGAIAYVAVSYKGALKNPNEEVFNIYFATPELCEAGRKVLHKQGLAAPIEELQ